MKKFLVSLSLIALAVNAHADGGKEGSGDFLKDAKSFGEKIKDQGAEVPYPVKPVTHMITLVTGEAIAVPAEAAATVRDELIVSTWQATKATGECMTVAQNEGKLGKFTGCPVIFGGKLVGIAVNTIGLTGAVLVDGAFRLTAEGMYVVETMFKDMTEYLNAHHMQLLGGVTYVLQATFWVGRGIVEVTGGTIVSVMKDGTVSLASVFTNLGQAGSEALQGHGKAAVESAGVAVGFGGCAVVDTFTAPLRGLVALINKFKTSGEQYPWQSCTYSATVSRAQGWKSVPAADPYSALRSN